MSTDLDAALAAANAALAEEDESVVQEAQPSFGDDSVVLPVGLETAQGAVTDAVVRELNGFDEEAVGRTKKVSARLQMILERGVVTLGDEKASANRLLALSIPDRTELLLAIRSVTWGDVVPWNVVCSSCAEESEVEISLRTDVPRVAADAVGLFDLDLPNGGVAQVRWPDGKAQERLMSSTFKSGADLSTYIIAACVETIDGIPLLRGEDSARALSSRVRQAIANRLLNDLPGPRLDDVHVDCPACGEDISVTLWLGAIFPI